MDYSSTYLECRAVLKEIYDAVLENDMNRAANLSYRLAGLAVKLNTQISGE
jgi:hypothetical protein